MSKVPDNFKTWMDILTDALNIPNHEMDWKLISECMMNSKECFEHIYNMLIPISNIFVRNNIQYIFPGILHWGSNEQILNFVKKFSHFSIILDQYLDYLLENNKIMRYYDIYHDYDPSLRRLEVLAKYLPYNMIDFNGLNFVSLANCMTDCEVILYFFENFSDELNLKEYEFIPINDKNSIYAWVTLQYKGYNIDLRKFKYKANFLQNILEENDKLAKSNKKLKKKNKELEREIVDLKQSVSLINEKVEFMNNTILKMLDC